MVLFRKLETISELGGNVTLMGEQLALTTMGNHQEDDNIDHGPFSLAYVCVKIDFPTAVGAQSSQPVIVMPLENITLAPSVTRTVTPWPTITKTPTLTPPKTATSTFTKVPPTPVPPTPIPPTDVPTEVVSCSSFLVQGTCERKACTWDHRVTGEGYCH